MTAPSKDYALDLLLPNSRMAFVCTLMDQYRIDVEGGESLANRETYKESMAKAVLLTADYSKSNYPMSMECVPEFSVFVKYLTGTILYDALTSFCTWMPRVDAADLARLLADDKKVQVTVAAGLPAREISVSSLLSRVDVLVMRVHGCRLEPYTNYRWRWVPDSYVTSSTVYVLYEGLRMLVEQRGY